MFERLQPRAHARDRAVVIGALHVDRALEAAPELRHVIRDVGKKVRVRAVALSHDAILVVAEFPVRSQSAPSSSYVCPLASSARTVAATALSPHRRPASERRRARSRRVEARLEEVGVEGEAERLEIAILSFRISFTATRTNSGCPRTKSWIAGRERFGIVLERADQRGGHSRSRSSIALRAPRSATYARATSRDVLALVPSFRKIGGMSRELAQPHHHRRREILNLHAGIVVVVLARDRPSRPLEQRR